MAMKMRLSGLLVAAQFLGTSLSVAQTHADADVDPRPSAIKVNASPLTVLNTGRTNPVLAISPRVLDFGSVAVGGTKQLSFTVKNAGVEVVTGTASVPAPFRIIAGSPYVLSNSQSQVIVVEYAPSARAIHMAAIHLTGGSGAGVTVTGSVARGLPPVHWRDAPTGPLLAGCRKSALFTARFRPAEL
jgi:hypothetical protein